MNLWQRFKQVTKAGFAFIAFCLASHAFAADPPTEFSKQVTALTGDWVAEDWREGELKLHPSVYTWQSDIFVTFYGEEPVAGRSAMDAARLHFQGFSLEDDSLNPTLVDMAGAKELSPGILAKNYSWDYAFDDLRGFWGVITTGRNSYIPFQMRCEIDDPERPDEYRFEQCLRKSLTLLLAVQRGQSPATEGLNLPPPPTPMNIAGWNNQYASDGTSMAVSSSGTRQATLYVTAPQNLSPDKVPQLIKEMSDRTVDDLDDQADKHPGIVRWVGTTADPWLRREYPEAFSGPSIHMAGTEKMPDGRTVLIGIRCPNEHWLKSCGHAVDLARAQVKLGIVEMRRQLIIADTQRPLPNNGIKDAQIFGIYTKSEMTMGYGGYLNNYQTSGYLYFKDGTVCDCFEGPLAYIDPVAEKAKNPGDWGRWTRAGNKINLRWNDGETGEVAVTDDNLMIGGTKATRLNGWYRHVSGGGNTAFGGASGFLSESSYTFFADGTFESDRSSSFSVGSGTAVDPGTTVVGGSSGGGAKGRYEVQGYTMKLTYPDGRISYLGYANYAHEANAVQKGLIMINGTVYFRDSDGK